MGSWEKFSLLMWKNWKLQIRKPISFLFEIGIPLLALAALILLRSNSADQVIKELVYEPFGSLEYRTNPSAFSPNTNEKVNSFMKKRFPQIQVKKNAEELEDYLNDLRKNKSKDGIERFVYGVQFDDDLPGDVKKFPEKLNVNIRCESYSHTQWYTEDVFSQYHIHYLSRWQGDTYGGPPDYYDSGFASLMYQLTYDLQKTIYNSELRTDLQMRRFPDGSLTPDTLMETLGNANLLGYLFMAAYIHALVSMVKSITLEKEKQLKESMKVMGLPTWLHWTAWFIQMSIPLFIVTIIITIGIKLPLNGGVLPSTSSTVLLVFLMLYVIGLITFSFFMSTLFSKANRAAALTGILFFLTMVPYIIVRANYLENSSFVKYLTSIFISGAMCYGFDIITLYESRRIGVQWNNIFETSRDNNFSMGGIMLMMVLDICLYLLLTLYIEQIFPGEYGIPQKWYFMFTKDFWYRDSHTTAESSISMVNGTHHKNEYFEQEPTNLRAGIKVMNLCKTFGANDAVKNLSLNLYEDQITVLLGHNGAGKTTTMSMLVGMFPPTRGTALVGGYDIRTQIMNVRDSMGICPQHNVLFDDLTVSEHIQFFCRLKGCRGPEVDQEVTKFLKLLNLEDKANAKSKALSGGMKRKLSTGIALCGKSKVIMLDEPTAGMDPSARRFIWEFLQREKKGRTILLTTHFMDEADLLGDRIAIMSGGEMKCCGSSFFLKKKYGTGYHLIIDQLPNCDIDHITDLIRGYIPSIEIESNAGTELSYLLPENHSAKFPEMLKVIETNTNRLGIRSFGISLTDLEEVFMKVGTNETGKANRVNNGMDNGFTTVTINSSNTHLVTGSQLYWNQILAIAQKKIISSYRSWVIEVLKIVLPVLYLILVMNSSTGSLFGSNSRHPSRNFTLDDYDDPVVLVQKSPNNEHAQYVKMLEAQHHNYELTDNITSKMLETFKNDLVAFRYKYIIGASFDGGIPTAWFNNEPYHSLPLAWQTMMNMYFNKATKHDMNFINSPLPEETTPEQEAMVDIVLSNTNILGLSLATAFVGTFYILFCIRERVSRAKHLQFVSGINVYIFWMVSFVCDLITYLFPVIAIVVLFSIAQPRGFSSIQEICKLAFYLFSFGLAALPFMYLTSYLFTIPSTGYARIFFLGFISGFPVSTILIVLVLLEWKYALIAKWIFRFIPHFDFISALTDSVNGKTCDLIFSTCGNNATKEQCKEQYCSGYAQKMCYTDEQTISMVMLYVTCIVLFIVIFLIDQKFFTTLRYKFFAKAKTPTQQSLVDEDVDIENRSVHGSAVSLLQSNHALVLKDLTKNYKNFVAVNGLNLTVKKSECFGLLGVNGAGKTTTFKMMTGDEIISYGDGWINGYSIKNQMKQVRRFIGYCPQFDALLDDLTARETLIIFSLIRGVPKGECNSTAEKLARDFDFTQHLDKQVKQLSGGNKRKLSTAIALIGDAPIIFLDEPTTGMDPATKRHLWNRLSKIRESGKSIILTSHSMEECEALCTRLAIMVNGNFQCLGSIQHLKSRFAEGFSVTLKVRKLQNSAGMVHADTSEIENFMRYNLPSSELREKHQELLTYHIKDKTIKWSDLFATMERAKRELNIEDYSVGQSSLEQVFLTFTKHQHQAEDEVKKKKKKICFCCPKCW